MILLSYTAAIRQVCPRSLSDTPFGNRCPLVHFPLIPVVAEHAGLAIECKADTTILGVDERIFWDKTYESL